MVGHGSAGEPSRANEASHGLSARERRGLERCRRALDRGRRVRGRPIASSDRDGLLLDLGGILGHVPPAETAPPRRRARVWRSSGDQWEGWVAAVAGDLVHLVAQRPDGDAADGPVREAEVLRAGRDGAVVRLDDGKLGVVPWEELSWEPALAPPVLLPGTTLAGRVVALSLDGPVLSPRAVTPSPWPAIALALALGTRLGAHVEARVGHHALLRTDRAPRARATVHEDALPEGTQPGDAVQATVVRVNAIAGTLVLDALSPGARAPRRARGARTRGRRGPGRVA